MNPRRPDVLRHQLRISERQWQTMVCDLATLYGWNWYHTHDSRRSRAGFPDLVLWHSTRRLTLFRELKTDTGRVSDAQRLVLAELERAGNDVDVWRPRDWDHVCARLRGETRRTRIADLGTEEP